MRSRKHTVPTLEQLSHSCPQCAKQITPPEMIRLDRETLRCPHCGDPYTSTIRKPPQPAR